LEAVELRQDDLTDEDPLVGAESPPLGEAVPVDLEVAGEEAVDTDAGPRPGQQDAVPVDDAGIAQAQRCHGTEEEASVRRIIGLGEVRVKKPRGQAQLLQAGSEAQVVPDIVRDVPAPEKG
jgi:hypothetical protein